MHTTAVQPHVMATIDNRVIEKSKDKKEKGAYSQNHQCDSKVPKYSDVEHHNYTNKKGKINIRFTSKIKKPYGSPSQRNCKPTKKRAEECNMIDDTFKEQRRCEDITYDPSETNHKPSKKIGCVCTCCQANNLLRRDCVIFVKSNYDFTNETVSVAFANRYREKGNKEFICKKCHTKMKSGHTAITDERQVAFTNDILKIAQLSDSATSAPDSSIYISQDPHFTDRCLCTCCHENNIPRTQCVVFKDSKYDMSSEYVQNTLSARFAIASSKEYICRSCHKSLLSGKKTS